MGENTESFDLPDNIERYLATLSKYYRKKKEERLQEIIVNSQYKIDSGSYNYGGIYGHSLYLFLPRSIYMDTIDERGELRKRICTDLNKIQDIQYEEIDEVYFKMEETNDQDWRRESDKFISNDKIIPDSITDRIWEEGHFRIFISHKAKVKIKASCLSDSLKDFGISCFVAHEDINPTKKWQNEIENALRTMNTFVALLTERFHDSDWTDQEVGFAFGTGVPIISVKLGQNPYGFIGKFQALSCSWEDAPVKIAKILMEKELITDPYIKAVKNCPSYSVGNKISKVLPAIRNLSEKQIKDLISAYNENTQVLESFGFNGKKPWRYGKGLLHHLERITDYNYEIDNMDKITIKNK